MDAETDAKMNAETDAEIKNDGSAKNKVVCC